MGAGALSCGPPCPFPDWMAFLKKLFSKEKGGEDEEEKEDEGKDTYDSILHEWTYDFDGEGVVGKLMQAHVESKQRSFPLRFDFGIARLGPKGEPEESEHIDLVMGHVGDLTQWAIDPKNPNVSGGPGKYPIVRTPNKPQCTLTLKLFTHAVKPTKYTLRHGWHTSFYAMRHWVLEAKEVNKDKWYIVSERKEDGSDTHPYTLKDAFGSCSFQVRGKFYAQELRIRQVGKNSGGYDDMYICGFEVYGKLRELDSSEIAVAEAKQYT